MPTAPFPSSGIPRALRQVLQSALAAIVDGNQALEGAVARMIVIGYVVDEDPRAAISSFARSDAFSPSASASRRTVLTYGARRAPRSRSEICSETWRYMTARLTTAAALATQRSDARAHDTFAGIRHRAADRMRGRPSLTSSGRDPTLSESAAHQ